MDQAQIENTLRKIGATSLKEDGQHFLTSQLVLKKILASAKLSCDDSVLEIGPGLGFLTEALLKKAKKVVAIEKDPKFGRYLEKTFGKGDNFCLLRQDFLKTNLPLLVENYFGKNEYKVVANIPYNISSLIIRNLLDLEHKPALIVFLIQREMAERASAQPPVANPLSIFVEWHGKAEVTETVLPDCFFPEPKVTSAILKIKTEKKSREAKQEWPFLQKIIKIGFSSPRKTLANNLSAGLKIKKEDLEKIGLEKNKKRPQELGLEEWMDLAKKISLGCS